MTCKNKRQRNLGNNANKTGIVMGGENMAPKQKKRQNERPEGGLANRPVSRAWEGEGNEVKKDKV